MRDIVADLDIDSDQELLQNTDSEDEAIRSQEETILLDRDSDSNIGNIEHFLQEIIWVKTCLNLNPLALIITLRILQQEVYPLHQILLNLR
jgi:hypothetical protein